MFTRCPECETTFRLAARDLRRAGGKVRCGECAAVFNALEYLEEDAAQGRSASNPWQTEPANDASSGMPDQDAAADEFPADTLYDDDYTGLSDDPADSQTSHQAEEVDEELDEEVDEEMDEELAEPVAGAHQKGWPSYSEPDTRDAEDDDEIVSFVTLDSGSNDYPEVSAAVSAAIGISQPVDDVLPVAQDDSGVDDEPGRGNNPFPDFGDDLDTSAADATIEFTLSEDDDDDNSDGDIVTIIETGTGEAEADFNSDEGDNGQPFGEAANADGEIDEFDDAVWERIPGVGSSEATSDEPLFAAPGFREPETSAGIDADDDYKPGREPALAEDLTDAEARDTTSPEDGDENLNDLEPEVGMDSLEFDAPANTWSNIFSRASRSTLAPGSDGDTQPVPIIPAEQSTADAEELAEWSDELNANAAAGQQDSEADTDAVTERDDPADWVRERGEDAAGAARLEGLDGDLDDDVDGDAEQVEWVIEAGEPGTNEEDWVTELDEDSTAAESFAAIAAPTGEAVPGNTGIPADLGHEPGEPEDDQALSSGASADSSEESDYALDDHSDDALDDDSDDALGDESDDESEAESEAESLTAAFSTGEYDEEEYDVQHIILSDESEPDNAGLTQAFAAAAEEAPPWQPDDHEQPPPQRSRAALWLAGSVIVVATLVMQLIHYNRDALAGNVAWGETVRGAYQVLGMELFPNWSLEDYEIRGSEAIAGESGPNIMDVRAQIAATGSEATGLPHIRIVLRDRWSNPVAAKTLGPAEYASAASIPTDALLEPNETLAAHVSIVDPGSGAQGFELELCLPRRHTGLECTGRPFE